MVLVNNNEMRGIKMLKLMFLTNEQEAERLRKDKTYSGDEINELAICAMAIQDISHIGVDYSLGSGTRENIYPSLFTALDLLINPILAFLDKGAPKAEKKEREERVS
jgi:hypothetical protein